MAWSLRCDSIPTEDPRTRSQSTGAAPARGFHRPSQTRRPTPCMGIRKGGGVFRRPDDSCFGCCRKSWSWRASLFSCRWISALSSRKLSSIWCAHSSSWRPLLSLGLRTKFGALLRLQIPLLMQTSFHRSEKGCISFASLAFGACVSLRLAVFFSLPIDKILRPNLAISIVFVYCVGNDGLSQSLLQSRPIECMSVVDFCSRIKCLYSDRFTQASFSHNLTVG